MFQAVFTYNWKDHWSYEFDTREQAQLCIIERILEHYAKKYNEFNCRLVELILNKQFEQAMDEYNNNAGYETGSQYEIREVEKLIAPTESQMVDYARQLLEEYKTENNTE